MYRGGLRLDENGRRSAPHGYRARVQMHAYLLAAYNLVRIARLAPTAA
jgi:hypothetical protein